MDFDLTEEQAQLANMLERWSRDHSNTPGGFVGTVLESGDCENELENAGYFQIAEQEDFGPLGGVLFIEAVSRTPYAVETGGSGFVAPLLGLTELSRPVAFLNKGRPQFARYLRNGGTALVDADDHVRMLECGDKITPFETKYAYPFGKFDGDLNAESVCLDGVSIDEFRSLRLTATAAEAVAIMEGALDLTVEYVRNRVQFGRPIGSLQAVQHRLSEAASVISASRLMTRRAAVIKRLREAVLAALHTRESVKRVLYETLQFHGATGLTYEYPLHLWGNRLRVLEGELSAAERLAMTLCKNEEREERAR